MHARVLYRLWCTCVCQSETDLINSRSIVSGCVIETINSWFTCGTVTMRPYYLIGWKGGPMPAEGSEGVAEVFGIHATLYTFTFISPKSVALLLSYIFFIFHATYIIHNLVDEIERSSICWASLSLGLKGNWYAYAVPKKKTYSENCRQMSNICISKYTPQEWRFTVWLQRCVHDNWKVVKIRLICVWSFETHSMDNMFGLVCEFSQIHFFELREISIPLDLSELRTFFKLRTFVRILIVNSMTESKWIFLAALYVPLLANVIHVQIFRVTFQSA